MEKHIPLLQVRYDPHPEDLSGVISGGGAPLLWDEYVEQFKPEIHDHIEVLGGAVEQEELLQVQGEAVDFWFVFPCCGLWLTFAPMAWKGFVQAVGGKKEEWYAC